MGSLVFSGTASQAMTDSFWNTSRTWARTRTRSASVSATMSRAPASAAFTSGTSFARSTNAAASASGSPDSPCARILFASASSPRSRAIMARVRRFGLYGR